jgi:hypothetical protein
MSAATTPHLDLTAPEVVKKISGSARSSSACVFALGSVALWPSPVPTSSYRGYLLGFMCWLGVALGSMAILMIRHLTGGGWGTVIRRILGAAMRTLPLLTVLFIPDPPWNPPGSTSGRSRSATLQTSVIREHLEKITQTFLTV